MSRTGIQPPNPRFITLHAVISHVLHLGDAAEIMDKVHDALFDEGTVPSGNCVLSDEGTPCQTLVDWVDDDQPPITSKPLMAYIHISETDEAPHKINWFYPSEPSLAPPCLELDCLCGCLQVSASVVRLLW